MIDINFFARKAAEARQNGQAPHAANGYSLDQTQEIPIPKSTNLHVTYRGIVYPWQQDHMHHMNVQHYVAAFDHASWVLLALLGLDSFYFERHRRGMAAVEQNIQYKSELHAGDAYEIRSKVLKVGERSLRMQHDMHKGRDGVLAATTAIIGVHIDADTRRSVALPDDVSDRAGFLNVSMLPSGVEQWPATAGRSA